MTVTIKARTAVLALALICVLAGLAIGQLTQANSAGGSLSGIERELKTLNRAIGSPYSFSTGVNGHLNQIEDSVEGTCRALDGFGC